MTTLRFIRIVGLALFGLLPVVRVAHASDPTWPSARQVWRDDFETPGIQSLWEDQGKGKITVAAAAAHPPSGSGLSVDVSGESQAYLQRYNLTEWPHLEFRDDTYVRFWFHPNAVSIPDGETIRVIVLRDADWNVLGGLRVRQNGAEYAAALELPDGSIDSVPVPMTNDWHSIVLGTRLHDWVGVWVDANEPRVITGVQHSADFVQVLILGKGDGNWNGTTPLGTVFFDDVTLLFATHSELWVDAKSGSDQADGTSASAPLLTIGAAAKLSAPGTVVHIAAGEYRESVVFPVDGSADKPIRFEASGGPHTVRVLGSESATTLQWTRLTSPSEIALGAGIDVTQATIWKADLAAWGLEQAPRFVGLHSVDGTFTRLPLAREPDWKVERPYKHHEFWWAAEGGTAVANCDPVAQRDCDKSVRSDRYLVDKSSDPDPVGVEPGSLATLGDVTGATVFVKDCITGHYTYRKRVAETTEPGRIRIEKFPEQWSELCNFDGDPNEPALGLYSKYFVEGLSKFLDNPGEWYFDEASQTIYLWTPDGRRPDELGVEIAVRDVGLDLSHRSYLQLVDLDVLLVNDTAIRVANSDDTADKSHGLTLQGLDLSWAISGIYLGQAPKTGTPGDSQIRTLTLQDCRIHDIDGLGLWTWTGSGTDLAQPGVTDLRIVHNEFARLGFRDQEQAGAGLSLHQADHVLFQGNHVHDIAHNSVHFSQARTRSSKGYDLSPEEIVTGDILVRGNLFENTVQNATDGGGLKFWGAVADHSDTFRDVLVYGNISRNNVGWAWVSEKRQNWTYKGQGGMGFYIDFAGGIQFFRNIAYNNGLEGFMASGSWIDQPVVMANNTFADSPYAFGLGSRNAYAPTNSGFDAVNNIFLHHRRFVHSIDAPQILQGKVRIDYNLYYLNGYEAWSQHTPGILAGNVAGSGYEELPSLTDVRRSLNQEAHGTDGDPALAGYDPSITDGTWQDFRLTAQSTLAIDQGVQLPAALLALLAKFGIDPGQQGAALDLGALEFDPANPNAAPGIDVGPADAGTTDAGAPWSTPDGGYAPPASDAGTTSTNTANGGSGCGCSVPGRNPDSHLGGWWLIGLGAIRLRRRVRNCRCLL
jgi:MYXO-CTERM domain-containing protein